MRRAAASFLPGTPALTSRTRNQGPGTRDQGRVTSLWSPPVSAVLPPMPAPSRQAGENGEPGHGSNGFPHSALQNRLTFDGVSSLQRYDLSYEYRKYCICATRENGLQSRPG